MPEFPSLIHGIKFRPFPFKLYGMENHETILEGHTDPEKGAYLGAIASIATADKEASPEELEYITELCESAQLSATQQQAVLRAATELSGDELTRCLDILKKSDLKYSLITDLMAFAKSDSNYSEAEEQNVHKIAQYLQVDEKQFSLLDEFAEKASRSPAPPAEIGHQDFLSSLGLKEKMQNAGINPGSLFKGLLGIAGPIILGRMVAGGFNNQNRNSNMFGGGGIFNSGGGLGSIIGMLSGGRGFGGTGGLLGRVLGGGY
jgi:uncharacterized tellurite resistance protein B-like protein